MTPVKDIPNICRNITGSIVTLFVKVFNRDLKLRNLPTGPFEVADEVARGLVPFSYPLPSPKFSSTSSVIFTHLQLIRTGNTESLCNFVPQLTNLQTPIFLHNKSVKEMSKTTYSFHS